jgi:RNA polymerase sigma factor (sigma-70 family)
VKYFVLKSGGSEEEAKDVIMDGIEALIRNIREGQYVFQDNAKLKTYFFQICRNKWFDYVNRKQRQKPVSLLADLNLEDFDNNYFYEFNEDLLNDRQRIVAELFDKSSDTCRQVLSYFYYDELSHDEIAERMGFSGPDSSKTQKNKCLRKLKSALKTILTGQEVADLQTN